MEFSNCTHGSIRIVGANTGSGGTVEFCFNQVWGTICGNSWDAKDANIVCGQLGFQKTGKLIDLLIFIILIH